MNIKPYSYHLNQYNLEINQVITILINIFRESLSLANKQIHQLDSLATTLSPRRGPVTKLQRANSKLLQEKEKENLLLKEKLKLSQEGSINKTIEKL
jgi:hypothetical protein